MHSAEYLGDDVSVIVWEKKRKHRKGGQKEDKAKNQNDVSDQRIQESVHESWYQVSDDVKCSASKNLG